MSNRSAIRALTVTLIALATPLTAATTLRVKGSDTIGGALGIELAEAYVQRHLGLLIDWEGLGSGTSFVGLFDGSADLGASSRAINENEVDEARRRGIQLREYVIAYDGIAVIVNPKNAVASLTVQQLSEIFQGKVRNWKALGGPDSPIWLISRPSYSGTHGFFRDKVLRRGNPKGPEQFAESTLWVEHSSQIVNEVAANPAAISYVGLGWAKPAVRTVPVAAAPGQPARTPSAATVRDGTYPIYRPLFMYSPGEPSGTARDLLAFILSAEGQAIVSRVGFVPTDQPSPLGAPAALTRRAEASPGFAAAVEAAALAPVVAPVSAAPAAPASSPGASAPSIERVFFEFGGAQLTPQAQSLLRSVAQRLVNGALSGLVVGHADAMGARAANLRTSQARAQAVYRELRRLGVPPELLETEAEGSDQPIATNENPGGRRQNRRVDVILMARTPAAGR